MSRVHTPPTCGSWYPEDAPSLRALLDDVFRCSRERIGLEPPPRAMAYVVPHAAPMYSGAVAAAAYRAIAACPAECIIIAGFCHAGGFDGIAIPDLDAYATPLGRVCVHQEMARRLTACGLFELAPEASLCDHSIEIQLPFLSYAAPQTPALPLYVGRLDTAGRARAALALGQLLEQGAILLASSDFTHFGEGFGYLPCAPGPQAPAAIRRIDQSLIEAASSIDEFRFLDALLAVDSNLCGRAPVALLLSTLRTLAVACVQHELDYRSSAELTGDFREFVTYATLAYASGRE